jgi:hypothetical protein
LQIKKEIVDNGSVPDTLPPAAAAAAAPVRKSTDIHRLAEYLIKIDPPTRNSGHDNSLPDTEVNIMSSLMKLADTELVDVINWAKSIPGGWWIMHYACYCHIIHQTNPIMPCRRKLY